MRLANSIFFALALAAPVSAAEVSTDNLLLQRLGAAVVAGDEAAARALMSEDAKILSYFNQQFALEDVSVLVANFEGLTSIQQPDKRFLAFDMCGKTAYSLQVKQEAGKIVEVRYGTLGFSPPPIPYSMRKSMVRCQPPVRIVRDPVIKQKLERG